MARSALTTFLFWSLALGEDKNGLQSKLAVHLVSRLRGLRTLTTVD